MTTTWIIWCQCLQWCLILSLGVPEIVEVKEAHVWSYIEEWTQPSWEGPNQPWSTASGKSTGWTQRHMGHHQWQVYGEVGYRWWGQNSTKQINKTKKQLNLSNILVCFSQTAQAGGSTAVLRQIHWCSPGPQWLAVQSGAPTSRGCSCWWRQRHGAQPDRQTQGTTPITHLQTKQNIYAYFYRFLMHL